MPEVSATEAARNFADLLDGLDGVEQRGERYRIVRRCKMIARPEPIGRGRGDGVKAALRRRPPDAGWRDQLAEIRRLLSMEQRP